MPVIARKQWCEGWKTGFWAASLLFDGRYQDYATLRDEFLGHAVGRTEGQERQGQSRELKEHIP